MHTEIRRFFSICFQMFNWINAHYSIQKRGSTLKTFYYYDHLLDSKKERNIKFNWPIKSVTCHSLNQDYMVYCSTESEVFSQHKEIRIATISDPRTRALLSAAHRWLSVYLPRNWGAFDVLFFRCCNTQSKRLDWSTVSPCEYKPPPLQYYWRGCTWCIVKDIHHLLFD